MPDLALQYAIDHVFLPPKLPHTDDSSFSNSIALINRCLAALKAFQTSVTFDERSTWNQPIAMMEDMWRLRNKEGRLMRSTFAEKLGGLAVGGVLCLQITAQNAGLIIRRLPEKFVFEIFELSARSKDVMDVAGRLIRCFPGPAIAVSQDRIADDTLRRQLANCLADLDQNTPADAYEKSYKAGSKFPEIRETVHPKYVSEMLGGILRAIGEPFDAARIYKRTRDEVLWEDTLVPWRRSPLWLLIRVALQTTTMNSNEAPDMKTNDYKCFMIYFMACLLREAIQLRSTSDTLTMMSAKIARRLLKLPETTQDSTWLKYVKDQLQEAKTLMSERWTALERQQPHTTPLNWQSNSPMFINNTNLKLKTLGPYLQMVRLRNQSTAQAKITLSKTRRIGFHSNGLPLIHLLSKDEDMWTCINEFESWVRLKLDGWTTANVHRASASQEVSAVLEQYLRIARPLNKPEDMSRMILTAMSLWVSLDKCAIKQHPLLRDYNPGIPDSLFEPLLLQKTALLEQLNGIEIYLRERKATADGACPPIFRSIDHAYSFSVRSFNASPHHQALYQEIVQKGHRDRAAKGEELQAKRREFQSLQDQAKPLVCHWEDQYYRRKLRKIHSPSCEKCRIERVMQSLSIDVHEWPLPPNELVAKSVVFYLDIPEPVAYWMETTYKLIVDTLSPPTEVEGGKSTVYLLSSDPGLSHFYRRKASRLGLASTIKPVMRSHYRSMKLAGGPTEDMVFVENGTKYQVHDLDTQRPSSFYLGNCNIAPRCAIELPKGPYKGLEYAVNGTDHSANRFISDQGSGSRELSFHESYAFCDFRAGHRLQWRNVACEIHSGSLNLSHKEPNILLLAAIWQVGPNGPGGIFRESHADLQEEEFGLSLLSSLWKAMESREGNWQGAEALRTYIAIATRVLSSTPHSSVQMECCKFLRRARAVTLGWARDLNGNLQQLGSGDTDGASNLTLEIAMTCHSTFDVEECFLNDLVAGPGDVADITECAITVRDRCPASTASLPDSTRKLLRRHWRRSQSLEVVLTNKIQEFEDGLHLTVSRLWAGYKRGTAFRPSNLGLPWLSATTLGNGTSEAMKVHYNVLHGDLLVNGAPLARLPRSYEEQPLYARLFGKMIFEVVPSTMPGMVFETRHEFSGHQLHFALHNEALVVRAIMGAEVYELLPKSAVSNDFPQSFIEDYVPWLRVNASELEWRPLTKLWSYDEANWVLRNHEGFHLLTGRSGTIRLIEMDSPTARHVHSIIAPLESPTHVHITLDNDALALHVHLPRLKLDFFLARDSGGFESKQFRGMGVDPDQSFGTLTGLSSKLVLKGLNDSSRAVVIPHGTVNFDRSHDRMSVSISTGIESHVSYYYFTIDKQLGRLVDDGSLRSKLFRCYLHAVTSHCLPDELTCATGTEEALRILRSASTRSPRQLGKTEFELLKKISQLTPTRQFYPSHLKVMQKVRWNHNLSPLSQHEDFSRCASSILRGFRTFEMFQERSNQEKSPLDDELGKTDVHLAERASIRNSVYYGHEFGAEAHTSEKDASYTARDANHEEGGEEVESFCISRLVDEWTPDLQVCQLQQEIKSWSTRINGIADPNRKFTFGYSMDWLESASTFLPQWLLWIQRELPTFDPNVDKYPLMFFLATMSFSTTANPLLIQTLLAFATVRELQNITPPMDPFFDLSDGCAPDRDRLTLTVQEHIRGYQQSPESNLPRQQNESDDQLHDRRRRAYEMNLDNAVSDLVQSATNQWPTRHPRLLGANNLGNYIDLPNVLQPIQNLFKSWHRNMELMGFVARIQGVLNSLTPPMRSLERYRFDPPEDAYAVKQSYVTFTDMFRKEPPQIPAVDMVGLSDFVKEKNEVKRDYHELESLLGKIAAGAPEGYEKRYVQDLQASFDAYVQNENASYGIEGDPELLKTASQQYVTMCQKAVSDIYARIHTCLTVDTSALKMIATQSGFAPRISPTSLLHHLSIFKKVPPAWKQVLVQYGVAITALQRAERIAKCVLSGNDPLPEIVNGGHKGWDPVQYPEWLLLEIENDLLIRPEQAQIAAQMISPPSEQNSIMQLNMGEGKSSVIVPIVAASLANGSNLARVVVLKPLASQMFNSLVKKLGGLIGRRIFEMPIARSLRATVHGAAHIRKMYEFVIQSRGILLVQPEHILSFELMGLDRLLSDQPDIGNHLIRTQQWLDETSRDILDESDEILSVNFELIYTLGTQRNVEFGNRRWELIQHVLGLANKLANDVLQQFPLGLELRPVCPGSSQYRMRILQPEGGERLMRLMAEHICQQGLPGFQVWHRSEEIRVLLLRFLADRSMGPEECEPLRELVESSGTISSSLLLLRGLICDGLLAFAFKDKRWRVNYGLDHSRSKLAVPYRAKDTPATRAEFSHPDVTIVLTCLTYYYEGLSEDNLRTAFEKVMLSDHAAEEYALWVRDSINLPPRFHSLAGINLADQEQFSQHILPSLRFAKAAVDFYTANVVFPAEMKEFPYKLSASGWNIAREKTKPTTGFSGTNDSRYILPLSVNQCDLLEQLGTNAKQLSCVLQPENTFESGKDVFDAESLLEMVVASKPPTRVILDVGAQVLELQNEQVAWKWLLQVPESDAQAVVYFSETNDLSVITRDGFKELLMTSPFAKQMDQCLVYLDEAHTRGTDLALPTNYRAAVTLGPNLTKDRLVQACMRMRKLAKGQSLMFCAPKDIQRKILDCNGKPVDGTIEVSDVLKWSISETWAYTRRCTPLWATQGLRYQRHAMAWSRAQATATEGFPVDIATEMREDEAQSIRQRYDPHRKPKEETILLYNVDDQSLNNRQQQVHAIRAKCKEFAIASFNSSVLQEEQERELSPEHEREQQIQHPPTLEAAEHVLHKDVVRFVDTGVVKRASEALIPAFQLLGRTTASTCYQYDEWPQDLFMTADFANTVKTGQGKLDVYLRPVKWIVSSHVNNNLVMVILSPFEANRAMHEMRRRDKTTLHVYAPRIGISMPSMDDLSFCSVPPSQPLPKCRLTMQLNLFAGQLYLESYAEYVTLCQFLALSYRPPGNNVRVMEDGFIDPRDRQNFDPIISLSRFSRSPVPMLRMLIEFRRKGQGFSRSHLGAILNGDLLTEERFAKENMQSTAITDDDTSSYARAVEEIDSPATSNSDPPPQDSSVKEDIEPTAHLNAGLQTEEGGVKEETKPTAILSGGPLPDVRVVKEEAEPTAPLNGGSLAGEPVVKMKEETEPTVPLSSVPLSEENVVKMEDVSTMPN